MNELQIIQSQLATERLHFTEVANTCAAALGNGSFAAHSELAAACADYFAFAVTRLAWNSKTPGPDAPAERWRGFLRAFNDQATVNLLLEAGADVDKALAVAQAEQGGPLWHLIEHALERVHGDQSPKDVLARMRATPAPSRP